MKVYVLIAIDYTAGVRQEDYIACYKSYMGAVNDMQAHLEQTQILNKGEKLTLDPESNPRGFADNYEVVGRKDFKYLILTEELT
jgi:hypothetical protein